MRRKLYEYLYSELTKDSDSFSINDFIRIDRCKLGNSTEVELVLSCKGVPSERYSLDSSRLREFDSVVMFIKYRALLYAQEIASTIVRDF